MNQSTESASQGHHGDPVRITVDSKPWEIPEGVYKVSELKVRFGIPAEYVLNEVDKHGTIKPLPDERSIHIKGGEVFVSQLPQGGSS